MDLDRCLEREMEITSGMHPIESVRATEMMNYEEEWRQEKGMVLAPERQRI